MPEPEWFAVSKTGRCSSRRSGVPISDWDGFFNNFYLYHDPGKTKKWYFLPWDEDKTWGAYDGMDGGKLLFDMPTTFGAEGDSPPGGGGGGFGGGWWRAGGYISRSVLANPTFK